MKKIQTFIYVLLMGFAFAACQDDSLGGTEQGGIRIALTDGTAGVDVTTRSTPSELFDGFKQKFKFQIKGDNYDQTHEWTEDVIPLAAGVYDITATCGTEQADSVVQFDKPCYTGTKEGLKVNAGETATTAEISCKVTNALVSLKFVEENEADFADAYAMIAVGTGAETRWDPLTKSAYFKAGSSLSKLTIFKDGSDSKGADILTDAQKDANFPKTFAAGDHLILTLSIAKANGNAAIKVSKVEVKKVTIEETIPLEWLPKPKVEATGFDNNNTLTFAETETKEAKLNLKLASALQDMRLKFDFGNNQFESLNRDTGYLLSNAEDKQVISEQLGIAVSDNSVDLNNLLAKIQTNAGETTTNTIEVDVKANNRWSSEDEAANRTYTITCNKPVFKVDAYPGNIWTKEFTMNALREEQVESGDFSKISQNIKYQYSTDGESNWTDLGDGLRQANLTPGTTYYIRGLYRDAVSSEVTEVKTYEAMNIPNSTLDDGYDTTYPKDDNPLYIFKGDWIDTRNELTCHSDGVNAFYVSKSSTLPINDNGSTVAHMMVIGWGAGNTCSFGEKDNWIGNSVINHISAGIACVGDYDVSSDVINAKEAYIRPSSLTFTYKASPYNGDEYLIEATLLNITDGIETIIGEGKLQSGALVDSYTTQSLDITYDESAKELPVSHVKVLFKAGTKEDRDHLEDKFRDASLGNGYSNAYIIGSQFWLDSFHFNYDK